MTREEILQIAKPVLFNTEMVIAVLEDRKTATRRVIKFPVNRFTKNVPVADNVSLEQIRPDKANFHEEPFYGFDVKLPCSAGDILYVRETWTELEAVNGCPFYAYKADDEKIGISSHETFKRWHPSIHMPKDAARIFLKVKDVRVERLQEITEEQASNEGAIDNRGFIHSPDNEYTKIHTAREHFIDIWNSTIKKADLETYGWDANPYVWAIEFEKVEVE